MKDLFIDGCAELTEDIVKSIGAIQSIDHIGIKKKHWKIVSSDGKAYILKKIYLPCGRIKTYQKICQMQIPGFQRVVRIYSTKNEEEYLVLSEWIPGHFLCPVSISQPEKDKKALIKKMADKLRAIHTINQQGSKVAISENDLSRIVDRGFISETDQSVLLAYMIDKLPIIQSRYCTIVHGDVHLKNILIAENQDIVFIDTDDVRFGDPYSDLVYAANLIYSDSEYYTYYLFIQYYFENSIPQDFWPIVNFYSIIKAINIMAAEVEDSDDGKPVLSISGFIGKHDMFQGEQPLWYVKLHERLNKEPWI